jgi:hypothetical protein
VQKDVLQASTIGEMLGLMFEAYVSVGPLPMGSVSTQAHKSDVLGMIPNADITFKIKAWFKHELDDEAVMLLDEMMMLSANNNNNNKEKEEDKNTQIVLVDCDYEDFADLSQSMITAYQDVVSVARGLESYGSSSGLAKPKSFYGHIFKGLDEDESGMICKCVQNLYTIHFEFEFVNLFFFCASSD